MDYPTLMAAILRAYPGLYREPVEALIGMLGEDGNYVWKNGEICPDDPQFNSHPSMDYSDLDHFHARVMENHAAMQSPGNADEAFHHCHLLRLQAERMQRELLDANMDTVVEGKGTEVYFSNAFAVPQAAQRLVRGEEGSGPRARFLYFPDDITPQWSKVLQDFHAKLLQWMNQTHGMYVPGETLHWPEQAQELHAKLELARQRLHPLLNNGQTLEEHHAALRSRLGKLTQALNDEESEGEVHARPPSRVRKP